MLKRLLWLALLALCACRTLGERQRMTIAEALNIYTLKKTVYLKGCQPTPEALRDQCWVWFNLTTECYEKIQAATMASELGRAKAQLAEMQTACDALWKLPEEVK